METDVPLRPTTKPCSWRNRRPPQTDYEAMLLAKPTQDSHGPRLFRKRKLYKKPEVCLQRRPKPIKNKQRKLERKNNKPATDTEKEKTEARRGKKAALPTKTHKSKKSASSHGDRRTLGQHAKVKQGTWPHSNPRSLCHDQPTLSTSRIP